MPSVETADERSKSKGLSVENGGQNADAGVHCSTCDSPDPERLSANRIEDSDVSQIDVPRVREFTQNDTINKFLLNSFLQRINNTTNADECREANDESVGEEQDQDFDS